MATITTKPAGALDPSADIQVSYEDQQKINKFARQNMQLQELNDELERNKKQLQNLEDAADDLLLVMDEDELIPYRVGEVYVNQTLTETQEMIESAKAEKQKEIEEINRKSAAINVILSGLKVQLYARFGTNINLEPEADD
ncbi:PREDICTED: prefoldin subunit 4-like [Priapulus caudatus]|uniref:Prefoldin subunit 4 n=1 Tax=Priapulus caudatus TaxID=37621 RepID=A0ABM1EY13_PRICU|nr:PREDICTED: prefoldin subunit 4-like [Priapulus caudatus]